MGQRSRLLGCRPADFSIGSDRAWRDGHDIASTCSLVNINPVVGGCAGGMWAKARPGCEADRPDIHRHSDW
jgi:hypothetical protein